MNVEHFQQYLIDPVLLKLDHVIKYSESASNLILLTCIIESNLQHLEQIKGPALGLIQMEPDTEHDIWEHYLRGHKTIMEAVEGFIIKGLPRRTNLQFNIPYQIAICRIHYYRVPAQLPDVDDIDGMAEYYKKYYNTYYGKSDINKVKTVYADLLGGYR